MNIKESLTEIFIIVLAALVLAVSVGFDNLPLAYAAGISFLIIIGANVLQFRDKLTCAVVGNDCRNGPFVFALLFGI